VNLDDIEKSRIMPLPPDFKFERGV
jgi:hypothetical protein